MGSTDEVLLRKWEKAPTGLAAEAKAADSLAPQAAMRNEAERQADKIVSAHGPCGAPPTSGYLRLEELRQRCTKPVWKLNP
jgi:hypothetical protein